MWTIIVLASHLIGAAPAFAQSGEVAHYYHTDAIGSVRVVTDQNGQVVSQHNYLPFGEEWLPPSGVDERIRFGGKEFDAETGGGEWLALNYYGARYLHGPSGRFTSSPWLNTRIRQRRQVADRNDDGGPNVPWMVRDQR